MLLVDTWRLLVENTAHDAWLRRLGFLSPKKAEKSASKSNDNFKEISKHTMLALVFRKGSFTVSMRSARMSVAVFLKLAPGNQEGIY